MENKLNKTKMNITDEQFVERDPKVEAINDLVAITTIMEDYWRFHPANEKQEDVVKEYAQLEAVKAKIEKDLESM